MTTDVEIRPANHYKRGRAKTHARVFSFVLWCILWLNDTSYSKRLSKGTNRNMYARNTLVKLLALYIDPESHNAQRYRQTDGQRDRRTTG